VALVLSLLPAYLYATVLDFNVAENWMVYGIAVPVCTVMLTLAYRNVARYTYQKLNHERAGRKKGALLDVSNAVIEAQNWSLFFNNIIYLLTFLFLAFYVLKQVPLTYNYLVSSGVAAALVWQLS
jgi:uncharacterized membrane protein (DUF485 family)